MPFHFSARSGHPAARLLLLAASLLVTQQAFAVTPGDPSQQYPTCQQVADGTCIDSPGSFIPPVTGSATLGGAAPDSGRAKRLATGVTSSSNAFVYYVDTYLTIHQMWFTGTKWVDANLMTSSQTGLHVALGTDVTVDKNGYVYYVDTAGTVHQMWFASTKWVDANLMTSSQSGVTVQPGSDVTVDAAGSVYYVSSFQTVRKMWWGGSKWLDADLMASSQTSYRVEAYTGVTVDSSYSVYYVSTGLTVQKMWWNGSQFVDADLMASSLSGLTVQPGSQVAVDASLNIYYVTAAQAIHQMSWPSGATKFMDVSIDASQPAEPGTGTTVDAAGSVYYVDTSQTVHKMYITSGQWVDANLMASTKSGAVAAPGTGVALDGTPDIYYVDPAQTIHEMYWIGTQFVDANLMASSQSGLNVSVAFLISGQVTNGGAGLNGVSVTLSGTVPSGTSVSQATTTATVGGIAGKYSFLVADGGSYMVAPALAGYTFSPPSQSIGNVSGNQSQGPFQDVPLPICASATNTDSPITAGTSEVVSVSVSSAASATVTFSITGATTNPYSNSIAATQVGKSTTYQATLSTSGLLGEYKVVPLVNNVVCSVPAIGFFNVTTGTDPSQLAAIKCSSMTGKWTDEAAGYGNLTWSIQNSGATISGTATAQDSCGNQLIWTAGGTYNSANQQYTLTGSGAAPTSCGGGFSPYDQIVIGKLNAGSCGLGSGNYQAGPHIVSAPPGTIKVSGANTLTASERIPDGENTVITNSSVDWLDQYGAVTTAQFNVKLSSSSGYNFGGRVVTEIAGTAGQGSDSCTYQGAPWPKLLTLKTSSTWNVQNDGQHGSYGPDLVGLSADQVAYIQAFSSLGTAGCKVSYPQIMEINNEANTANEAYAAANSGDNTLTFSVTPTNITVTRGNASVTRAFHF